MDHFASRESRAGALGPSDGPNTVTPPATSFTVRRPDAGMVVIDVAGDVTAGSEEALMRAFDEGSNDATDVIALDFGNLEYMNSGGIGLLVTLLVRANRQRQRLVAFGLNEHYRQIFELTRLDEAISLYDDERRAIADMQASS
jgi:anti-sigma B factor antagonist